MWLHRRRGRGYDFDYDFDYDYDYGYGYELNDRGRAHDDGWQLMADGYDRDYVNSFHYAHVDDCADGY